MRRPQSRRYACISALPASLPRTTQRTPATRLHHVRGSPAPALERAQQGEVRERARAEEKAVHPAVDAVEEERPARGDDRSRKQGRHPAGEACRKQGDDREARDGEEGGERAQTFEAEIQVRDRPREQEVERRAAALLEHDLEDLAERVAADEERQCLVLVRRPSEQLVEEETRRSGRQRGDSEPEPMGSDPRANSRSFAGSETLCLCRIAHG